MKNLDEVFKLMESVETKHNKPVKLSIYHDGSGTINFNSDQRAFNDVELLQRYMVNLDTVGRF